MRFLIGKQVYEVAIVGATTDLDKQHWVEPGRVCVLREQTIGQAVRSLIDGVIDAHVLERGGFASDDEGKSLAELLGGEQAALDVVAEYQRQFRSNGGPAALAELMGLDCATKRKAIDWSKLTREQAREATLRHHHAYELDDEQFVEYREKYEALHLNPLAGDCVPKLVWNADAQRDEVKVITTIAAMRRTAGRTGMFAGCTSVEWQDEEGNWRSDWPFQDRSPFAARAGVYRKDCVEPIMAVVEFDAVAEFYDTRDGRKLAGAWARMGPHMNGKCAYSRAFAAAFPECNGLYIAEEMMQTVGAPPRNAGPTQGRRLGRVPGTVNTQDGDDDAIDSQDDRPVGGRMAELHAALMRVGCYANQCQAIIDYVRERSGTFEDDNWEGFAQACVQEARNRMRRR